jgi:hypothetical protein
MVWRVSSFERTREARSFTYLLSTPGFKPWPVGRDTTDRFPAHLQYEQRPGRAIRRKRS